ncbi:hypothetical protein SAMN05444695_1051, partial [Rhodococcus triatomae]
MSDRETTMPVFGDGNGVGQPTPLESSVLVQQLHRDGVIDGESATWSSETPSGASSPVVPVSPADTVLAALGVLPVATAARAAEAAQTAQALDGLEPDPPYITAMENFHGMTHVEMYQKASAIDAGSIGTLAGAYKSLASELDLHQDLARISRVVESQWEGDAATAATGAAQQLAAPSAALKATVQVISTKIDELSDAASSVKVSVPPPPYFMGPFPVSGPAMMEIEQRRREAERQAADKLTGLYAPSYTSAGTNVPGLPKPDGPNGGMGGGGAGYGGGFGGGSGPGAGGTAGGSAAGGSGGGPGVDDAAGTQAAGVDALAGQGAGGQQGGAGSGMGSAASTSAASAQNGLGAGAG